VRKKKKDLELIRKLFIKIETFPISIKNNFDYEIKIDDYSKEEINFNLLLMKKENLIDGIFHRSIINKHIEVNYATLEITAEGYKFFDTYPYKNKSSGIVKQSFGDKYAVPIIVAVIASVIAGIILLLFF